MKLIATIIMAVTITAFAADAPKDPRPDVTAFANTATQAQLEDVPGIGPKLAAAIIKERPYKDSAAVDAVKGIGPILWAMLCEHVENIQD